jgi:hypothetical protein
LHHTGIKKRRESVFVAKAVSPDTNCTIQELKLMEVVRNEREFKRQKDETAAIFERLRVKSKEVYRKMSLFFMPE